MADTRHEIERYKWVRDITADTCDLTDLKASNSTGQICRLLETESRLLTQRRCEAWQGGESVYDVVPELPDVNGATIRELVFQSNVCWTSVFQSAVDRGGFNTDLYPSRDDSLKRLLVVCPGSDVMYQSETCTLTIGEYKVTVPFTTSAPNHDVEFVALVREGSEVNPSEIRLEFVGPEELVVTTEQRDLRGTEGVQASLVNSAEETSVRSSALAVIADEWSLGSARQFALLLEEARDAVSLSVNSDNRYQIATVLEEELSIESTYHPMVGHLIFTWTPEATTRVRQSVDNIDESISKAESHRLIGHALGYPDSAIAHFVADVHLNERVPSGSRMSETAVRLHQEERISTEQLRCLPLVPYITTGNPSDVKSAIRQGEAYAAVLRTFESPQVRWPPAEVT